MTPVSLALALSLAAAFVVAPITGAVSLIRAAPFLLAFGVTAVLLHRPWRWDDRTWNRLETWRPANRDIAAGALVIGALLFWFVLTRFQSASINAVDFTVYYERPNFQTLSGRLLFVESADDPLRSWRTYFAVHAHWIMLPVAAFYALWSTPLWVLALSVTAVVAGSIYTYRIVDAYGGGAVLGAGAAFAYALNDNTARTLNYGFHTEVLYAWFVPWMLHAGLTGRWRMFGLAALATISVKEDAFLLVLAAGATILLVTPHQRRDAWPWLAGALALALANLVAYYTLVVPQLSATGEPFYANYWSQYGPTTTAAAVGMLQQPWRVLYSTATSALMTKVLAPHLFALPFIGWRWAIGIAPVALLYGASANEQMRSFSIYYSIVLVPFLVLASAAGALRCACWITLNDGKARGYAAAALVSGALIAGISDAGYSLRPWRPEIGELKMMLASISEGTPVLVQSALYPHAGYAPNVQLLSPVTLADPRFADAIIVLAPQLDGYPLKPDKLAQLAQRPRAVVLRAR